MSSERLLANRFECIISDVSKHLVILKTEVNNEQGIIKIEYADPKGSHYPCLFSSYESFRVSVDECDLLSFENFDEENLLGNVVYFEKSGYLDAWKSTCSADLNEGRLPIHYLIMANEDWVEVLSYDEPEFNKL